MLHCVTNFALPNLIQDVTDGLILSILDALCFKDLANIFFPVMMFLHAPVTGLFEFIVPSTQT